MDVKVFWAVLAALGVAGLVVLGYQRIQEYRAWEAFNEFTQTMNVSAAKLAEQARAEQAMALARQNDQRHREILAAARREETLSLSSNEQCLGGTVVRVDGSVYTQTVGRDGRPERCEGLRRLAQP